MLALAFILVNAVCTYYEFYYFNLLPAALLVAFAFGAVGIAY